MKSTNLAEKLSLFSEHFKFAAVRYRGGQERHAGVRGLCVGQLVYGARPFAAHSMGVVRSKIR